MKEQIINDLLKEMNEVVLYDVVDQNGNNIKTIKCDTICAILTIVLDKYIEN